MKRKFGLVQIFRGFAAMLVVLCHLSGSTEKWFKTSFLNGIFLKGYIGVDFFFVLSGFIITYIHFNDVMVGSNKLTFLKKRAIRIYPIFWITLSVYVILLFLANGETTHLDHIINFRSISDWRFILQSYFLVPVKHPLLGVTWSLTYEIIFYSVFFIFILIGFKKSVYLFFTWAALILSKIVLSGFYSLPEIIILNQKIFEFLAGCIVAYFVLNHFYLEKRQWNILFLIGMIILYWDYPDVLSKPSGALILSLVMGLIVYKIVIIDIFKDNKYSKLLLLVGDASYSIYLSHLIFLSLLLRIFQKLINTFHVDQFIALQLLIAVLFLMIIAAGMLIFRFIESPILRYLNKKLL